MAETESRFLHVQVPGTDDDEAVIRLDADPDAGSVGNIIAGGHGVNGSLHLFRAGSTDTTEVSEAAVSMRASNLDVRFRRPEPGSPVSMELIGGLGKIFAGGAPETSAEIVLRGPAEEDDGGSSTPVRIRLLAEDPVTGDATVTVGGADRHAVIQLVNDEGALAATISTDESGSEIVLGNAIRLRVGEPLAPTAASLRVGGSGFDGALGVTGSAADGDEDVAVNLAGGRITLVHDDEVAMRLDAVSGNIRCGGSSADGDVLLYPQNSDIDATAEATMHLDGGGGSIRVGTSGRRGLIAVQNADAEDTVVIDGESGDIIMRNADCAEEFDIDPAEDVDPGAVLILGPEGLRPCDAAYDKKVVGVMSGAGGLRPGILLDRRGDGAHRAPVALVGKTYCNVIAEGAPVEVGDLITTSDRKGFAMKATDPARAFGAILGKALRPLERGRGRIPVLVSLQ